MAVAFASTEDVASLYGTLSDSERERAGRLLDVASALLRSKVPGVDLGVAVSNPALVATVVADAVARALRTPGGVKSVSRATGPFSESVSYADAASSGGLFFTDDELHMLGGSVAASRRVPRSFRIKTTEPVETPVTWWTRW